MPTDETPINSEKGQAPTVIKNPSKLKSKHRRGTLTQSQIAEALRLSQAGVPQTAIATGLNVTKVAVCRALKRFEPIFQNLKNVDDYRAIKGQILDAAAMTALQSLVNPEKHEKASLNQAAYTFDVLDKASGRAQGNADGSNAKSFTQINIQIVNDTSERDT